MKVRISVVVALAMFCILASARGEGPQCEFTTELPPLSANLSFTYDAIARDMLDSPGVVTTAACTVGMTATQCLLVPKFNGSSSCEIPDDYDKDICAENGSTSGYDFCMVSDEFSQLGLVLALGRNDPTIQTAFERWVNTVRILSADADSKYLPLWNVRVTTTGGSFAHERWNDDDASDATARIILALYVAAASPQFSAQRASFEELAGELANRFAHHDVRDTLNRYGAGRFWLAAGKNAAANPVTNNNPFTYAGYFGDAALAMLAAYRSTGEPRYASLASDILANYLRATDFTASFAVPPMKFSWDIGLLPPRACCREYCPSPGQWDGFDAPRAVNVCKAAYYIARANVPVDPAVRTSLDSYCTLWMQSNGVLNESAEFARQYFQNGTRVGNRSTHYLDAGLGASLNFHLCADDLERRLMAAAAEYDPVANVFDDEFGNPESCIGVYTHAFFIVNYGSAIGRDLDALLTPIAAPANLTVTRSGQNNVLSWSGAAGMTFEIARGCNEETFAIQAPSTMNTTWTDVLASNDGTGYLYKVRAASPSGARSQFTPPEAASDTPIEEAVPRVSEIRAADIEQVRNAVNRMRAAAGNAPLSYSPIVPGVTTINASQFTELQAHIAAARSGLGLPPSSFTAIQANQVIRAIHMDELKKAARGCDTGNLPYYSE